MKKLKSTTASTATAMPAAVVISASEMPLATTANPPAPAPAIERNDLRMPHTVPKRPTNGSVAPMVASIHIGPRISWTTSRRARSMASAMRSGRVMRSSAAR